MQLSRARSRAAPSRSRRAAPSTPRPVAVHVLDARHHAGRRGRVRVPGVSGGRPPAGAWTDRADANAAIVALLVVIELATAPPVIAAVTMPPKTAKATRPRVYARIRPMFGRDAGRRSSSTSRRRRAVVRREPEEGAQTTMFQLDKVFNDGAAAGGRLRDDRPCPLSSLRQGFNARASWRTDRRARARLLDGGRKGRRRKYTSEGRSRGSSRRSSASSSITTGT